MTYIIKKSSTHTLIDYLRAENDRERGWFTMDRAEAGRFEDPKAALNKVHSDAVEANIRVGYSEDRAISLANMLVESFSIEEDREDGSLTDKEKLALRNIAHNDFVDGDPERARDEGVWTDCLADGPEKDGPTGLRLSGVVSSLTKKGMVVTSGFGRDAVTRLTDEGYDAVKKI